MLSRGGYELINTWRKQRLHLEADADLRSMARRVSAGVYDELPALLHAYQRAGLGPDTERLDALAQRHLNGELSDDEFLQQAPVPEHHPAAHHALLRNLGDLYQQHHYAHGESNAEGLNHETAWHNDQMNQIRARAERSLNHVRHAQPDEHPDPRLWHYFQPERTWSPIEIANQISDVEGGFDHPEHRGARLAPSLRAAQRIENGIKHWAPMLKPRWTGETELRPTLMDQPHYASVRRRDGQTRYDRHAGPLWAVVMDRAALGRASRELDPAVSSPMWPQNLGYRPTHAYRAYERAHGRPSTFGAEPT